MNQIKLYKDDFIVYLFFLICLIVFSIISGFRPVEDFSIDTDSYISFFLSIASKDDLTVSNELIEPGFVVLTYLISRFTSDFHIYLSLLFFLFNSLLFVFWKSLVKYLRIDKSNYFLLVLFGFTLSSNWYNNFSYNGLRQGLAAPLLYLSIVSLTNRKYFKSLFFLLVALSFHKSALLVFIFYPIVLFRVRYVLWIYFLLGFIYVFNISELLVKRISDQINPLIYASIAEYGGDDAMYVGFSLTFFLYSFFFVLIIFSIYFFKGKFISRDKIFHFYKLFKIYVVLIAPFFVFGFAGFSNRYAVYGWFFMPLFFTILLWDIKLVNAHKNIFLFFLLLFALYKNLVFYFYV